MAVDLSLTVDLSHLSVGQVDFVGGGGSSLFVILWVWVDFMVWWCIGECGFAVYRRMWCISECRSAMYRRVWCIGECGSGLISWVWAMVVWQVWLILGFDFGGCDLILVGFVVGVEIGVGGWWVLWLLLWLLVLG